MAPNRGPGNRPIARRTLLLASIAASAGCAADPPPSTKGTAVPTPSPLDPVATTWHGEPGYRMATPTLSIVILNRGGKIVSLVTPDRREWLAQPADGPLASSGYGADFISAEMCGWDECVPTVDATQVGAATIPDHGEVWSVTWEGTPGPGTLAQAVEGQALPYRLSRTITNDATAFTVAYSVTNTGTEELPFLWCGHPQFLADETTTVMLDGDVARAEVPGSPGGDPFLRRAGTRAALADQGPGTTRKTWFEMVGQSAAVALRHGQGPEVRMAWETSQIPYVAVWQDHARYAREAVVAPELSNGWYDDLARAAADDHVLRLAPEGQAQWSFVLSATDGSAG